MQKFKTPWEVSSLEKEVECTGEQRRNQKWTAPSGGMARREPGEAGAGEGRLEV